jgi:hypothetical protein
MVAWHGVPGTAPLQKSRPVGYGLIASRRGHASRMPVERDRSNASRRGQVKCLARENNSSHSGPREALFWFSPTGRSPASIFPFTCPISQKSCIPKEGTGQK